MPSDSLEHLVCISYFLDITSKGRRLEQESVSKLLHSLNHHIFILVSIIKQLSGSQQGMESATIGDKAKWWWLQLGNLSFCLLGLEVDQKEQVTAKDKWSVIDWIHCRLLVFCVTSVEELRSVAKPMPLRSCQGQELKQALGSPKDFVSLCCLWSWLFNLDSQSGLFSYF